MTLTIWQANPDFAFPATFWEKVEPGAADDACWLWTGAKNPNGYGVTGAGQKNGSTALAHRVAFELEGGVLEDGRILDHVCRVRHCVNPRHMEQVTQVVNMNRSAGFGGKRGPARRTHCSHGHELTEQNTYVRPSSGQRTCRTCNRARHAVWRSTVKEG